MKKGSIAVFIVVFAIALAILGVFAYKQGYLGGTLKYSPAPVPAREPGDRVDEISKLEIGDEVESIEKDLAETNLDTIDQDVLGVNTEAEAL